MKRNKQSSKAMRQRNSEYNPDGSSPYATKVKAKRQMYGPGCCAHRLVSKVLSSME